MDKTPIQWMVTPLRRYVDFSGRARRAEYWWFSLFTLILLVAAIAVDGVMGFGELFGTETAGPVYIITILALALPGLAVTVRRFHDQDKSGWNILFSFIPVVGGLVLLWFMTRPGTPGRNRFGDDPLPHTNLAEDFA